MTSQPLPENPSGEQIEAVLAWARARNDQTEALLADARKLLDGRDER